MPRTNAHPYAALAAAILLQAAKDWRKVLKPRKLTAKQKRALCADLLDFYRSKWFYELCAYCEVSPVKIITLLKIPVSINRQWALDG